MPLASYQVVDVLLLVGNVAPIALYFLALGLVNSHSRPYLISTRADFVALTSVLVPVVFWPMPTFARSGTWWPLVVGGLLVTTVFLWMLPRGNAGFVIYNISELRCMRLFEEAARATGLAGRWDGKTWRNDSAGLTVHVRSFALLRNVSLHVERGRPEAADRLAALGAELQRRLESVAQLPSTMGAGLVLIGLALLIAPMWMVGRHIDDLVDAMSHLFG